MHHLQIGEELSAHDALQQHVQVGAVLVAGHQVHHEAAAALRLNLLFSLHMRLWQQYASHTQAPGTVPYIFDHHPAGRLGTRRGKGELGGVGGHASFKLLSAS